MTAGLKISESDEPTTKPERRETEDKAEEEYVVVTMGHISEGKPLVLLQVNCRSICNNTLPCKPIIFKKRVRKVIIGELKEDIACWKSSRSVEK